MCDSNYPESCGEMPCPELNALGYRIILRKEAGLSYWTMVWWPKFQKASWKGALRRAFCCGYTEADELLWLLKEAVEANQNNPRKAGFVEAALRAMHRINEEASDAV